MKRRHERHAAHYQGTRIGHDLEWFVFASPTNTPPPEMPADAEYRSGYVADGVQHWVYIRRLPLSAGTCHRCEEPER